MVTRMIRTASPGLPSSFARPVQVIRSSAASCHLGSSSISGSAFPLFHSLNFLAALTGKKKLVAGTWVPSVHGRVNTRRCMKRDFRKAGARVHAHLQFDACTGFGCYYPQTHLDVIRPDTRKLTRSHLLPYLTRRQRKSDRLKPVSVWHVG